MAKTDLEPGRRDLVRDERVFRGRDKKCRRHTWIDWGLGGGHAVVACGVCGRIKRDQTMPATLPPVA